MIIIIIIIGEQTQQQKSFLLLELQHGTAFTLLHHQLQILHK